LGLDIGDRWIGVAVSDPGGILATPLVVIDRKGEIRDIQAIDNIIKQYDVKLVIAGLPKSMNGSIGEQAKKVQTFIHDLNSQGGIPIEFRDERLSTISAQRMMREAAGKSRKNMRDDAAAAAIILQSYLDEKSYGTNNNETDNN
jgi:putative Holliday junction resolvase